MPFSMQMLAWLGAEVILIETRDKLHSRILPPYADGIRGINRAAGFNLNNTDKLSCTIDLSKPEGLELVKRVISISDVLAENYATGSWDRLGLGYEAVRQIRPDIVYLSLAAFGRSGPMKNYVGLHSAINLFSGLAAITGYPGTYPRVLGGIFPDLATGCYCVLAVLQALYHRSNTGEGQYIEATMTEALTSLIPEAVADYTMNGIEPELVGNRERGKAPHDVYRCMGDQKWVAISVEDDSQWQAMCLTMGHPEWATDPRFADNESRWKNQDDLVPLIESWTESREAYEVMHTLQQAGVAAGPTLNSADLLKDPHLNERDFVAWVDHPENGRRQMGTVSWRIDGERLHPIRHAPLMGEHNEYVLGQLLHLDSQEIDRLTEAGVVA